MNNYPPAQKDALRIKITKFNVKIVIKFGIFKPNYYLCGKFNLYMVLGSHNSWSYLPVRKWWMKPIAFMAKCQNVDIRTQYELYGVRCFDLRIRYADDGLTLAHGIIEYDYSIGKLFSDLDFINGKEDCYVRVLFEARDIYDYLGKRSLRLRFRSFCQRMESYCNKVHWWCGRNLYNWEIDYYFGEDPTCEELYGSVSNRKWLYAWWPWLYAVTHNRKIRRNGTDKEILLIDYVNYE